MCLRKQTLINSFGSLTLLGCQWIISVLLVRVSGYEDAGVFSLAMSIANVFSMIANYGMRYYQVSDVGGKYTPNQFVAARFVLSGLAFLSCVVYVRLDGYSLHNALAICLYLSYNLSFVVSDILMGNLQMAGHLEINGYSNTLRGVLSLLFFSALHLWCGNLLLSLAAMSIGSLLVLIVFDFPQYFRYCQQRGTITDTRLCFVLQIGKDCFFTFIATIIPIIITAIPRRSIQMQLGESMLGVFSSIYTPMSFFNTLIPTLILSMIPGIAMLWGERSFRDLRKTILKCYGIVVVLTLAGAVFALLAGKLFLRILYGAEILPYSSLLVYSVIAIGLNCACVCGGYILVAFQSSRLVAVLSGLSAVIMLALSDAFVGRYEIFGGAYALMIAYAVQIMIQLFAIAGKLAKRCDT